MHQTHARNVAPMHEANRRRWDLIKQQKAIETLKSLGWVQHPLTWDLMPPEDYKPVKTNA